MNLYHIALHNIPRVYINFSDFKIELYPGVYIVLDKFNIYEKFKLDLKIFH
jgi:hypothetical protein